ncbi:RNA polymerase, sigma-24 subunit, ECF subfamily [Paenibacillus curdlanolyticus YK9]|uniref:RNA polymerase, sigma-24 subunit, ECF subfamily n=1 Tax=Paenibacillus curdlanolyticus YK9 TaxID=717606 RepID=E0I4M3_9BACL|nr:RNA polymerase sigma-70 factor [Paenibacillus curdlanolyticus]EFM12554.1 RNA polymerase, sigma-24 subunit, ECF subfamily [Paenibacillus curdlanolyticus YK9]
MVELYERYHRLLFQLAYQLIGSVSDAEDAVQDVFEKLQRVQSDQLAEPKAYLCKMVTNRCLDHLRSARVRREQYVGPWLPEPIAVEASDDAFETVVRNDLLSYALLALMERLTPAERAVFVLREALGFDYPAIAELIDKSEANCRKLMSRARGKMGVSEEELSETGSVGDEWIHQFLAALSQGKVDTVLSLLAEDAVCVSDGGGKVLAAIQPIVSRERVARFLLGIIRKEQQEATSDVTVELMPMNGQTGIVLREGGSVTSVILLQVKNGLLHDMYIVRNPDKLAHLQ